MTGRIDQTFEKAAVALVRGQVLGVPLDADDEVAAWQLNRLDDPVGRVRDGDQTGGEAASGLMVEAIRLGREPVGTTHQVCDERVACDFDLVGALVSRRLLIVVEGAFDLIGNVLPERSAERDIQDLHAAADGEERKVAGDGGLGERQLERVALGLRRHFGVKDLLAVVRRIDVFATGEKDAVDVRKGCRNARRVSNGREQHRESAGPPDCLDVCIAGRDHLAPERRFSDVRGDADQRRALRG